MKRSLNKLFLNMTVALVVFALLIVSGCQIKCPDTCDDIDACTEDICSEETGFECAYKEIFPCRGNGVCEEGEYDAVTADCPDCDDGNICTADSYDYDVQECINEKQVPCCGNGVVEQGETCNTCAKDFGCSLSQRCCDNSCEDVCLRDSDCDDSIDYTQDTCENLGTCDASCINEDTRNCISGDNECPEGCSALADNDCKTYKIGDSVMLDDNTELTFVTTVKKTCRTIQQLLRNDFEGKYIVATIHMLNKGTAATREFQPEEFKVVDKNSITYTGGNYMPGGNCDSSKQLPATVEPGTKAKEFRVLFELPRDYDMFSQNIKFSYDPEDISGVARPVFNSKI